jgi:hypothetical protein
LIIDGRFLWNPMAEARGPDVELFLQMGLAHLVKTPLWCPCGVLVCTS